MQQSLRDLRHAAVYLCAVCLLIVAIGVGGAVAYRNAAIIMFDTAALSERQDSTRIGTSVQTARAIRAALAKPIPGPEPLPPVTAKLAHPPRSEVVIHEPKKKPSRRRLPDEAMNAMAMDVPQARSAHPEFELHKVY